MRVPRILAASCALLLGGLSLTAACSAAAARDPLWERLSALARVSAAGMEAMAPAREEDLGEGDPRNRDLVLEQGRCYQVVAVAEAPLRELVLALSSVEGAELARATGAGKGVVLASPGPVCPARTGSYALRVSVRGGSGRALWQLYGHMNPALATRWAVGSEATTYVARRMRALYQLRAPGKIPAMPFEEGSLQTAEVAEASFEVSAGACYMALVVGVPSLRELDLELVDARGVSVAEARSEGGGARVSACADSGGRWTVRVRAFKGYGAYGVQVFGP